MMSATPCLPQLEECTPANCQWRCALRVIDELLSQPGAATGDEVDGLLDLRWHLARRDDAEAALRTFCDLRRRMEQRHYLSFFRVRRWLENHLVAEVSGAAGARAAVAVRLEHYCVEAVRRVALCGAMKMGGEFQAARVRFGFRHETANPIQGTAAVPVQS